MAEPPPEFWKLDLTKLTFAGWVLILIASATVLGVSALARSGSSPGFSNRDPIYNDIAAPGEEILSTLPRHMTAAFPQCQEQGYSITSCFRGPSMDHRTMMRSSRSDRAAA